MPNAIILENNIQCRYPGNPVWHTPVGVYGNTPLLDDSIDVRIPWQHTDIRDARGRVSCRVIKPDLSVAELVPSSGQSDLLAEGESQYVTYNPFIADQVGDYNADIALSIEFVEMVSHASFTEGFGSGSYITAGLPSEGSIRVKNLSNRNIVFGIWIGLGVAPSVFPERCDNINGEFSSGGVTLQELAPGIDTNVAVTIGTNFFALPYMAPGMHNMATFLVITQGDDLGKVYIPDTRLDHLIQVYTP